MINNQGNKKENFFELKKALILQIKKDPPKVRQKKKMGSVTDIMQFLNFKDRRKIHKL